MTNYLFNYLFCTVLIAKLFRKEKSLLKKKYKSLFLSLHIAFKISRACRVLKLIDLI